MFCVPGKRSVAFHCMVPVKTAVQVMFHLCQKVFSVNLEIFVASVHGVDAIELPLTSETI